MSEYTKTEMTKILETDLGNLTAAPAKQRREMIKTIKEEVEAYGIKLSKASRSCLMQAEASLA